MAQAQSRYVRLLSMTPVSAAALGVRYVTGMVELDLRTLRLDVRPLHERGEEPFEAIMHAVDSLRPGQDFLLINSFEPTPLYRVMEKRGFTYQTSEIAPDEWHITFRRKA